MEAAKKGIRKILMLPWLAFGHISPFVELAKTLSHHNLHIYLCSSPVNLHSIRSKLPQNFSPSIELLELELPSSPELPPHFHTTNGLPLHLIPTLLNAFDMATPQVSTILKELNPDLLILDVHQPQGAQQIARSLNIPIVNFVVVGAITVTLGAHLVLNQGIEFPFPDIYLRKFTKLSKASSSESEAQKDAGRRFFQWVQDLKFSSDVVLVNSFTEIEGEYMDYLSVLWEKKIVPVAPLLPEVFNGGGADEGSEDILKWLDKKDPKSTVYASFGSEYYLSKEDREELAHGLEMSGANFIWVVRFSKGEKISIEEALPEGFMERVGERGLVVDGWAPQMKILKHASVGGFVCHCGWNSVMEAMVCGVPIVALPMQLDQPGHARLAVAAGVGVEAERGDDGGVVREGVAKAIKEVVFEEKSVDLRRKVGEISEILKGKEGKKIEGLVAELDRLCDGRKLAEVENCNGKN